MDQWVYGNSSQISMLLCLPYDKIESGRQLLQVPDSAFRHAFRIASFADQNTTAVAIMKVPGPRAVASLPEYWKRQDLD